MIRETTQSPFHHIIIISISILYLRKLNDWLSRLRTLSRLCQHFLRSPLHLHLLQFQTLPNESLCLFQALSLIKGHAQAQSTIAQAVKILFQLNNKGHSQLRHLRQLRIGRSYGRPDLLGFDILVLKIHQKFQRGNFNVEEIFKSLQLEISKSKEKAKEFQLWFFNLRIWVDFQLEFFNSPQQRMVQQS